MRNNLLILSIVLSAVLTTSSIFEWLAINDQKIANKFFQMMPAAPLQVELDTLLDLNKTASSRTIPEGKELVQYARVLKKASDLTYNMPQRIDYLCQSLGELAQAIKFNPNKSSYLIQWVHTRQLLGTITCPQAFTNSDYSAALEYALKIDAKNAKIVFAAAMIYNFDQKYDLVKPLFRRYFEIATSISDHDFEQIMLRVNSEQDLKQIVPELLVRVLDVSKYFKLQRPAEFIEFSSSFAQLQTAALLNDQQKYNAGLIPADIYLDRLVRLLDLAANSQFRQFLDSALSAYYARDGQTQIAEYFSARKFLNDINVSKSVREIDSRPLKTNMYTWNSSEIVYFDEIYKSIGIYVPIGRKLNLIELVSKNNLSELPVSKIKLFVSDDNQNWLEYQDEIKTESIRLNDRLLIALQIKGDSHRYYKLHFDSSERNLKFVNTLDNLLRVYGS